MTEPTIIAEHVFALGICVPKVWSNDQIEVWINRKYRASLGDCQWHVEKRMDACENDVNFQHVWVTF